MQFNAIYVYGAYGTVWYRCIQMYSIFCIVFFFCCLWCFHLDSLILAFSIVDVSGQIHLVVFFVSPMMTSTSMHRRKAWLHCSATKSKTPKAYQIQCQHHHPYSVNKFMIAPLTGMTSEILCVYCVLPLQESNTCSVKRTCHPSQCAIARPDQRQPTFDLSKPWAKGSTAPKRRWEQTSRGRFNLASHIWVVWIVLAPCIRIHIMIYA